MDQAVNHFSTGFDLNRAAPSEWKEYFRMSRESFLVLCTELNDHIVKSSTWFRKAVSAEEQVALTLYYLSDEGRLRKTASAFGLGKPTISHIIRHVYKAIISHLTSKYVKMPRTKEAVDESVFYSKHGFLQCIRAIGGTYVLIK